MTKVLKVIPLLLALVLLASVPAAISAKTENSGGALRTTVGQVAPSVSISADANAQVRLNLPVSVTVRFSEPVSGFTLDEINVVNGTASNFSDSDGDEVYTFDVTPTSLDVVTVDIAAGVAKDGEGNDNTAAQQLSLGIPYDFDGSGGIGRAETIAAIRDYFDGNITRAQAIAVIRLYFSPPAEPEPEPGPGISDDCIQAVSSDGTLNGQWASGCDSETRSGSHARYYTFTLDASSEVTIRLESSAANTHLYLRRGDATSGTALHENDDHGGSTSVSQIQETLAAGTYTIEATTDAAGSTGSFTLTISGLSGATPTDPGLLRYAADNAGGPGAIYVGDINQLVGPAPDNDTKLGDGNGMVLLEDLRYDRWLYESGYYRSLLDRANLTDPTPLASTGENIKIQYVCIHRSLLPCILVEKYWAPNLEARTNGQLTLEVRSFTELGLAWSDTLALVANGTLAMAEVYGGYSSQQQPLLDLQFLTGLYPHRETMFYSVAEMLPGMGDAVEGATGGGVTINHNWYAQDDLYIFSQEPLRTVDEFEDLRVRSSSSAMSDWLGGMGAEAQLLAFADVYTALERGILGAAVTSAVAGYGQRLYEIADYINGPLTNFSSNGNVINADLWNSMPEDLQQILVEEGAKTELEAMRLAPVQDVEGVRRSIEAGLELVEFSSELKERGFDVAVMQHVIPGWLSRVGYPGAGEQAVEVFNAHVGPYVGLQIQSDGSVEKTEITKGRLSPIRRPSDDCRQTTSYHETVNGQWISGCDSQTRSGSPARYYTFTLDISSEVTVRLSSSGFDTYLYLRRGDATSGTALHENDNYSGSTTVSQIQEMLSAGTYTIEATHGSERTGHFTLMISVPVHAAPNSAQDFDTLRDAGNTVPQGIWSDGTTMWVTDRNPADAKIYAYNLATKQRDAGKDFDNLRAAGNNQPRAIWSDGTTMWVADRYRGSPKIYAYSLATKQRDAGKDFDNLRFLGIKYPRGIWSDGTTMWVAVSGGIYAFSLATKQRDAGKDFRRVPRDPQGIWSDGTTMWVADLFRSKIYAYNLATKQRDYGKDFGFVTSYPLGIWSDGRTMWVAGSGRIYAFYILP